MPSCVWCKSRFHRLSYFHPNQKYCSKKCIKDRWHRKNKGYPIRNPKKCKICENVFIPKLYHPQQETCSRKCSSKLEYIKHKKIYFERVLLWRKNNRLRYLTWSRMYQKERWRLNIIENRIQKKVRNRAHISKKEWYEICNKAKFRCQLSCGKLFQFRELSVDHIIPIARGGTHGRQNLQPACLPCNQKKGGRMFSDEVP